MVGSSTQGECTYRLWLEPQVHVSRAHLPGNLRQRIKRSLNALASDPRLPESRPLDLHDTPVPATTEMRRLRLGRWRVIYAVNDSEKWVWVLGIRRRPPYEYDDLPELAAGLL